MLFLQVFLFDLESNRFRFHVLFDDMLKKSLGGISRRELFPESGSADLTFGDLEGRPLALPPGVFPYHRLLL